MSKQDPKSNVLESAFWSEETPSHPTTVEQSCLHPIPLVLFFYLNKADTDPTTFYQRPL